MNPGSSITKAQINNIWAFYKLGANPVIERINIGFTNELYKVDHHILKIYARPQTGEKSLDRETRYLKSLYKTVLVPKLIAADKSHQLIDKPFIIYEAIAGEPLGGRWHSLTDQRRQQIIKDVCRQLRLIAATDPLPKLASNKTWQQQMMDAIFEYLGQARQKRLLTESVISEAEDFVRQYAAVLKPETLGLMYWDVHLDNLIVDDADKLVGIVDFEHVDVVSIDFVLTIIRQLVRYPHLSLSEDQEYLADKKDYQHLMEWFGQFYPELFDFPELERRIDLYELIDILRLLPRFPNTRQLHDRLALMLSSNN